MAGIQDTPLRVPDVWDPTWFRTFVTQVIAKADVRNAVGYGVTISSDGNSVATISADAETTGAITGHNLDPLAHVEAFNAHKSENDPHPQYRLPVGSIFLTVSNVNPAILLGYGTWTQRAEGELLIGAS